MPGKIKMEALMAALSDTQKDIYYFFDKQTKEVIKLSLDNPDVSALKSLKEKIAKEKGRFPQIPRRTPHDTYKDMEAFIKTLKDVKLQKRLLEAIEGQGAFRGFRDVLEAYPREKQRWNTFRDDILKKSVLAFLREAGISAQE
ncbi:MAG: UPF0158 family protein [Candidatus Eremiobacteraeota bacterium]|nr:UPF0158 family protein [Candidatus Eremiobacteraeota bacterium]